MHARTLRTVSQTMPPIQRTSHCHQNTHTHTHTQTQTPEKGNKNEREPIIREREKRSSLFPT